MATLAGVFVMGVGLLAACSSSSGSTAGSTAGGAVLLVGTFHGHAGRYTSIQAAVDAARPGDWILIAPGDYHETADESGAHTDPSEGDMGGVLITTSRPPPAGDGPVHGDRRRHQSRIPRRAARVPPPRTSAPSAPDGKAVGRNGILVWKADDVYVENLTVCNFLAGTGDSGNEIWWNGGDGSGTIGLKGYWGDYLTATSTYFSATGTPTSRRPPRPSTASSRPTPPGRPDGTSSTPATSTTRACMSGACHQLCDVTIDHAWMEFNALGYSGTNSGGAVVIENSQFDDNQDGVDTNTQIDGDPPAPQNGACPDNGISPITHTHSCWVFIHNDSHNNNNANVPEAGNAAAGPIGTGMTLSGGRNDTVMDNTFSDNGAWGFLMVPFPDSGTPSLNQSCPATGGVEVTGFGCVYDPEGDALLHNTFSHNGFFGNPSNSDFGQIVFNSGQPQNCFAGNTAPNGSAPPDLEQIQPTCGRITTASNTGGPLLDQVLCDSGIVATTCPAGSVYPTHTGVVMHPLPKDLPTMPNPCVGVPANPWCPGGKPV